MRERIFIIPSIRGLIYFGMAVILFLTTYAHSSIIVSITTLVCLSFYILSMLMAQRNLRGLSIGRMEIEDGAVGQKGFVHFQIENAAAYKRNYLYIELLDANKGKMDLRPSGPFIFPDFQSVYELTVPLKLSQRGLYQVQQMRLKSPYPFAWFTGVKSIIRHVEFYAYPEPVSYLEENLAVPQDHDGDFYQHQNYLGQNSRVDWKLFARRNLLLQKVFEEEQRQNTEIRWQSLESLKFEERLSQICYWLLQKAEEQSITLYLPHRTFVIENDEIRKQALRELAVMKESQV